MGWLPTENDLNFWLREKAINSPLQQAVLDMPYSSKISGNVTEFRKPTLSYAN